MSEEEERNPKGFVVRDRRRFTEEGEARPDAEGDERESAPEPAAEASPVRPHEPEAAPSSGRSAEREPEPESRYEGPTAADVESARREHAESTRDSPPSITFETFVMSLGTQALAALGEIANPMTGESRIELDTARELIDILSMLGEKTQGNLDREEARLMESLLYDLRMRFVERKRKHPS